jgi:vacuolar protein sorting-associated protein 51
MFNARAYYEQLITTSSLPTLIKRENELIDGACVSMNQIHERISQVRAEIRNLDSERQSLVYNHHHELIAASDTIRAVGTLSVLQGFNA